VFSAPQIGLVACGRSGADILRDLRMVGCRARSSRVPTRAQPAPARDVLDLLEGHDVVAALSVWIGPTGTGQHTKIDLATPMAALELPAHGGVSVTVSVDEGRAVVLAQPVAHPLARASRDAPELLDVECGQLARPRALALACPPRASGPVIWASCSR
jgi:hypothetical protein